MPWHMKKNHMNDHLLIKNTMISWCDDIFGKIELGKIITL